MGEMRLERDVTVSVKATRIGYTEFKPWFEMGDTLSSM